MPHQRADAKEREQALAKALRDIDRVDALVTAAEEREKRMTPPPPSEQRPSFDRSRFPVLDGIRKEYGANDFAEAGGCAVTDALNLTSIREIRAWIEAEQLNGEARRVAEGALGRVRKHWSKKRRDEYNRGLAERDRQHEDVVQVAHFENRRALEQLERDLKSGVLTSAEARARLRDLEATRVRLAEQHQAIDDQEKVLEALDAETTAAYQERTSKTTHYRNNFSAFGGTPAGEMTFGQALQAERADQARSAR